LLAYCELMLSKAETPDDYGDNLRWAQIPLSILLTSLVWFVRFELNAGRSWLAWAATSIRLFVLGVNFLIPVNLNFSEITRIDRVPFLGGTAAVPIGMPNLWSILAELGVGLMVFFCVDATIAVWRRRGERRDLLIGATTASFIAFALYVGITVVWGLVHGPIILSFVFLAILLVIAFELSFDAAASARLTRDLIENEERMTLAVDAANLGIWVRDLINNEIWASDKWRELFGFSKTTVLNMEAVLQRVHPSDREYMRETFADTSNDSYEAEYRILSPDGEVRWIASRGSVEFDSRGLPVMVRGTSLDITSRVAAEDQAHELSGRLIDAQENERERLARELHDDVSQRLALLSIELELVARTPPQSDSALKDRMRELSDRVGELSGTVRRLSHELHPAALRRFGLVSTTRSFCREISAAHEIEVEFDEQNVPSYLPDDISLCFYRVMQESLRNVAKHARATKAKVTIAMTANELRLTVCDNGDGFDTGKATSNGSLGLISMRERMHLVNGRLSIKSVEGVSTKILATVPCAPEV